MKCQNYHSFGLNIPVIALGTAFKNNKEINSSCSVLHNNNIYSTEQPT